jgi:hypothetical protein
MHVTAAEPFLPDILSDRLEGLATLEHGAVSRGDVPSIVQASERTGQRVTKSLIENGYVWSEGHTGELIFVIPPSARDRWFPALYPNLPAAVER